MLVKPLSFVTLLACALQASAHALINPALGVQGTAARSDVTKPSTASPCGNGVNVASAITDSQSIQAASDGSFAASVTNFNAGTDGSTEITKASVDTTATGNSFAGTVQITKNGVKSPTTTGTTQISATLPSGTTCTGGSDGASCLVSFTTAGGFGNCVLVSQGSGVAASTGTTGNTTASSTNSNSTTTGTTTATDSATDSATGTTNTTTATDKTNKNKIEKTVNKANKASGARLARALRVRKALGESLEQKRQPDWVWAPNA